MKKITEKIKTLIHDFISDIEYSIVFYVSSILILTIIGCFLFSLIEYICLQIK
jgi:hypothetical protein